MCVIFLRNKGSSVNYGVIYAVESEDKPRGGGCLVRGEITYFVRVRVRLSSAALMVFCASTWVMSSALVSLMDTTQSPTPTPAWAAFPPGVSWTREDRSETCTAAAEDSALRDAAPSSISASADVTRRGGGIKMKRGTPSVRACAERRGSRRGVWVWRATRDISLNTTGNRHYGSSWCHHCCDLLQMGVETMTGTPEGYQQKPDVVPAVTGTPPPPQALSTGE